MKPFNNDFGEALEALRAGKKVMRPDWEGHLVMQFPDENSKMNQPYIYAVCRGGQIIPAVINQLDMLAGDWKEKE